MLDRRVSDDRVKRSPMRVMHRISVATSKSRELLSALQANGVPFEADQLICGFDIGECEDYEKYILALCKELHAADIVHTEYDQDEYKAASWYTIRSQWHWSYPQPEEGNAYRKAVYDGACQECGCGRVQKGPFRVKTAPRWGTNKFFAMLYWVEDELFASDTCVELLNKYQITGFEPYDVLDHKAGKKLHGTYQLKVNDSVSKGVVFPGPGIRELHQCQQCGSTIASLDGRPLMWDPLAFRGSKLDVYQSAEMFGSNYGHRKILISKKCYDVLQKEKMARGLVIEPLLFG